MTRFKHYFITLFTKLAYTYQVMLQWLILINLCFNPSTRNMFFSWMMIHCLWLHFQVFFLYFYLHKSRSLHPLTQTLQILFCHLSCALNIHYLGTTSPSFLVLWPGKQINITFTWYPLIDLVQHVYTFLYPFRIHFINPLGTTYFLE